MLLLCYCTIQQRRTEAYIPSVLFILLIWKGRVMVLYIWAGLQCVSVANELATCPHIQWWWMEFCCGTHSQGCNLHNRILKILLKFLFSWILYQDCPSPCVPRTCKHCISEIPQRNFLSFPQTIHLAPRIHSLEHGTHTAADIPMNRFPFVTYWPSLWHIYSHDIKRTNEDKVITLWHVITKQPLRLLSLFYFHTSDL